MKKIPVIDNFIMFKQHLIIFERDYLIEVHNIGDELKVYSLNSYLGKSKIDSVVLSNNPNFVSITIEKIPTIDIRKVKYIEF